MSTTTGRRIEQWLSSDGIDKRLRRQVRRLRDAGNDDELEDRFGGDLKFGPAGVRGLVGAGTNRVNSHTIARVAQGLAHYIRRTTPRGARAVIACDSRRGSREFARVAASVLAANRIRVYLFRQLRPAPLLSFAVRHLKATAGLVITAGRQPEGYNGCKVYWEDGSRIVPPHGKAIAEEVAEVSAPDDIRRMDFDEAVDKGRIEILGAEVDRAYISAIRTRSLHPESIESQAEDLGIVYTPLHGSGGTMIPKTLRAWGFRDIEVVPTQARPDGDFPRVERPDPAAPKALAEALALARQRDADIVMGTDPDADRLAAAVRVGRGRYSPLTAHQLGALMADYLCREMRALGRMPRDPLMVTSLLTSDLIEAVGEHYGVAVEQVLPGFRWIGAKIRENEERYARGEHWKSFIYGADGSSGYLIGTAVRDSDAIVSACVCAEMAARARIAGTTLVRQLDEIEMRHGAFREERESLSCADGDGPAIAKHIMDTLRRDPPHRIGGIAVDAIGDLAHGCWESISSGRRGRPRLGTIDLPACDLVILRLVGGSKIIICPWGADPRIQFFFHLCERETAPFENVSALRKARAALDKKMKRVRTDCLRQIKRLI